MTMGWILKVVGFAFAVMPKQPSAQPAHAQDRAAG